MINLIRNAVVDGLNINQTMIQLTITQKKEEKKLYIYYYFGYQASTLILMNEYSINAIIK